MTGPAPIAMLLALALTGCAARAGQASPPAATPAMAPRLPAPKRVAPPPVKPLRIAGLRIEALPWARDAGFDQNGGVIAGFDARSGERRWLLQVYRTVYDPAMESDVQDVFITGLRPAGAMKIMVEDERNRRWLVDLASQAVTRQR